MNDESLTHRWVELMRAAIVRRPNNIRILKSEGNINAVLMNYGGWCQDHLTIGILQWRRGHDPRFEFSAGLDVLDRGLSEASALGANVRDIDQLRLDIAQPIAYLMDRALEMPDEFCPSHHELPDVVAGYLLGDALFDRPYLARLPAVMAALNGKKRQMLAALSFQTYFDLLDSGVNSPLIYELAAQADALYLRRKKDVFYSKGTMNSAGGEYNDLLIDCQLGAVLKKVGFEGESIHRWRWN